MTYLAISREVGGNMIRVCCGIEICQVTSYAGIGRVNVISIMAENAIVRNGCVRARERIIVVMVKS